MLQISHLAIWCSIVAWILFLIIYSNVWPVLPIGPEMAGMDTMMFSSGVFWMGLFLIPIATLFIDYVYKIVRRTLFKTVADEVRELEMSHLDPSVILPKLARSRLSETARLLRHAFSFKRVTSVATVAQETQRGYAFSQEENGVVTQSQIVRAYDSTKAKPEGQ